MAEEIEKTLNEQKEIYTQKMDKLKSENEKILQEKNKELENMKTKFDEEINQFKKGNDDTQKQIENLNMKIAELTKLKEEYEDKIKQTAAIVSS